MLTTEEIEKKQIMTKEESYKLLGVECYTWPLQPSWTRVPKRSQRPALSELRVLYRAWNLELNNHAVATSQRAQPIASHLVPPFYQGAIGLISSVDGRHWCPTMRPLWQWRHKMVAFVILYY